MPNFSQSNEEVVPPEREVGVDVVASYPIHQMTRKIVVLLVSSIGLILQGIGRTNPMLCLLKLDSLLSP